MSSRDELSRVALGSATLHEVFIVSVPDCLLVKQWSRAPRSDGASIGVHLGRIHGAAAELLGALGAQGSTTSITLETDDTLIILSGVARGLVAGLVFDRSAPLGLARLQSSELVEQIRASIQTPAMPAVAPLPVPPAPRRTPPVSSPRPEEPPEIPQPRFDTDAVRTSPRMPRVQLDPPPTPESIAPTVAPPPSTPAPAASTPQAAAPTQPQTVAPRRPPSAPAAPPSTAHRTRAARLIEVLRQSAPDAHTVLLRLSLRTGIGLDVLERPESLTDAQTESIATSVRDLLGREVAV